MTEYSLDTIEGNVLELEEEISIILDHRYECLKIERLIIDIKKLIATLRHTDENSMDYTIGIEAAVLKLKKAKIVYEEMFPTEEQNQAEKTEDKKVITLPSGKEYTVQELESLLDNKKEEPDESSPLELDLDDDQRDIII